MFAMGYFQNLSSLKMYISHNENDRKLKIILCTYCCNENFSISIPSVHVRIFYTTYSHPE